MTSPILSRFRHGLQKTRTSLQRRIQGLFTDGTAWDETSYEDLEAALIATDLGVDLSLRLVDDIRNRYKRGQIHTSEDIMDVARIEIRRLLTAAEPPLSQAADRQPGVVLLVGVNGSGKTTTAAKLAHRWQTQGRAVMLAAADTFRAAAVEQLQVWGRRLDCPVIAGAQGGDAAAVAFDAATAACHRAADYLIVDTAGRQHTRRNLMAELEKIGRTLGKACPGAPHETWLTVDASSGSNALVQAREFGELCHLTGLILTKLDGTGKGGVVVAIRQECGYPVRYVGLGEGLTDLEPFDPALFAEALFA